MVARNFLEVDPNIFYPRIDIAGDLTGITGMEFPLLNYLIYLVSRIFSYQHWYGRLINLMVSSMGLWFFYKLAEKYFSPRASFYATIILAGSIWFQFSRKIMPDTFAMSFILAAIYFGTNYFETEVRPKKYWHLTGYVILMMLGVLSKLPSGYLLVVFGLFLIDRQISFRGKLVFVFVSFLGAIPVLVWYFYWVPYLVDNFGFWHFFMGKSFGQGFSEVLQNMPATLGRFSNTALKYLGFAGFLFGLIYALVKKEKLVVALFLLSFFTFCLVIFKSGFSFPHHDYYVIPFVPVMALVAGYGLAKIANPKIAIILLIAISLEGIANQQHDFRLKDKDLYLLNLETELDKISHRDDLFIINSSDYPTPMYFAHRKGWVDSNEMIESPAYINELVVKGLAYILILKSGFGTDKELESYERVLVNKDYCIYKAKTIADTH